LPNSVVQQTDNELVITNYEGKVFRYIQPINKNKSSNRSSENTSSAKDICQIPS